MARVADIIVNIPVKNVVKAYSYYVPSELSFVDIGWRVFVPFGARKAEGFVVRVRDDVEVTGLKPILSALDEEAWFDGTMLELSEWLAAYYLCSLGEAMRLFMPGKSGGKIIPVYRLRKNDVEFTEDDWLLQKVYRYVAEKGEVELSAMRKTFPHDDIESAVRRLEKRGYIVKEYLTKKNATFKVEKYIRLKENLPEDFEAGFRNKPAQRKIIEYLMAVGEASVSSLRALEYSLQAIREVLKAEQIISEERRVFRDSYNNVAIQNKSVMTLTAAQQANLAPIVAAVQSGVTKTFLLHGITGSGKTQIYIEAVKAARFQGKAAIILVPEIGLTSQMIERFQEYFPQEIIVMHSRLSINERNDAVAKIRSGGASIVIGARSAIFAPVERLGLIIMDEEHDTSYKQDEAPRYHARDVAIALAELHGAVLLLGSATPSLESFYAAKAGKYQLLTLDRRIGDAVLPEVRLVDMRSELRAGRRTILSCELQELITETLAKQEQVILLLNRRGFSTFIMCRECGHVIACEDCTLPLTYHKNGSLLCHFCNIQAVVPDICPKCASRYIKYFGSGTEKLETELTEFFPDARVVRMDRDTTGGKFAHAEILADFKAKRYDILLGTQMVAKGHDIENVTAVGIISADASLNMPDFRAAEKCFALITQAAGRAGRGGVRGKVVVQTYNPTHYAVKAAAKHDYDAFYREEEALRSQLLYPPYSALVKIVIQHTDLVQLQKNAMALRDMLQANLTDDTSAQVMGPVPAHIARLRDTYRYILLIKSTEINAIKKFLIKNHLDTRKDITLDINPLALT